jgi:hypothetical protein
MVIGDLDISDTFRAINEEKILSSTAGSKCLKHIKKDFESELAIIDMPLSLRKGIKTPRRFTFEYFTIPNTTIWRFCNMGFKRSH